MSLEYYLFCREKYGEIVKNLDSIIEECGLINHYTKTEENVEELIKSYNLYVLSDKNNKFFLHKKTEIIKLMNICDKMIKQLCKHEFVNDIIDITPDRSENITYCKNCGFTK